MEYSGAKPAIYHVPWAEQHPSNFWTQQLCTVLCWSYCDLAWNIPLANSGQLSWHCPSSVSCPFKATSWRGQSKTKINLWHGASSIWQRSKHWCVTSTASHKWAAWSRGRSSCPWQKDWAEGLGRRIGTGLASNQNQTNKNHSVILQNPKHPILAVLMKVGFIPIRNKKSFHLKTLSYVICPEYHLCSIK